MSKRRLLLLTATASAAAALASGELSALAATGRGYSNYDSGTFSSGNPSNYTAAPELTAPGTVDYAFEVTDNQPLFLESAQLTGTVFVERIRSYQGAGGSVDVTDARIFATEDDILSAPSLTGDLLSTQQLTPQNFSAGQSQSESVQVTVPGCGYWAIYVASQQEGTFSQDDGNILNAGVVRVTQGCATSTPGPSPTPLPTPRPTPTPTATPAPTAPPTTSPTTPPGNHTPGGFPRPATSSTPTSSAAIGSPSPSPRPTAKPRRNRPAPFPFARFGDGPAATPSPDPADFQGAGTTATYEGPHSSTIGGPLLLGAIAIIGAGLVAGGVVQGRELLRRRRAGAGA